MTRKNIRLLLLTCLLLALCTSALAVTESEWNARCTRKTSKSTNVYVISSQKEVTDEYGRTQLQYTLSKAGTLPAGTYLVNCQHSIDGKFAMQALVKGVPTEYYIPAEAITTAYAQLYLADGRMVSIPEKAYGNDAAVRQFMSEYYNNSDIQAALNAMHGQSQPEILPDYDAADEPEAPAQPDEVPVPAEQSPTDAPTQAPEAPAQEQSSPAAAPAQPAPAVAPAPSAGWAVFVQQDDGSAVPADLITLGTYASTIRTDGGDTAVPTASLRFAQGVEPQAKPVASVVTKKTGSLTLRSQPDTHASALGTVSDGCLAGVIEPGDKFTLISYQGVTGYVLTSSLVFYAADQAPAGEGTLTAKKNADVPVYLTASKSAKRIDKQPSGLRVTIWAEKSGYVEIEYDGVRAWVKKANISRD